ncbi:membrane dipeptidase [Streptomyces scopuliridis]
MSPQPAGSRRYHPRNVTGDTLRALADNPKPPCGIREISDHIEHVRDVAGIDHVGIGSDFDGMTPPDDMASTR